VTELLSPQKETATKPFDQKRLDDISKVATEIVAANEDPDELISMKTELGEWGDTDVDAFNRQYKQSIDEMDRRIGIYKRMLAATASGENPLELARFKRDMGEWDERDYRDYKDMLYNDTGAIRKSAAAIGKTRKAGKTEIDPNKFDLETSRNLKSVFMGENPAMQIPDDMTIKIKLPGKTFNIPPRHLWGQMGEIDMGETLAGTSIPEKIPGFGVGWKAAELYDIRKRSNRIKDAQEAGEDILSEKYADDMEFLHNLWIVDQYRQARGQTWGGMAVDVMTDMPAFVTEFFASGGLASGAKAGAQKMLAGLGKGLAAKAVRGGVGLAASAAARTATVGIPRVAAGYLERTNPKAVFDDAYNARIEESKETPVSALYKAVGDTFIEYLSEESGEVMGKLGGQAVQKLASKSPKFAKIVGAMKSEWLKIPGRTGKWANRLNELGWNGMLMEMGEERLGSALRNVTGVSDEDIIPEGKQLLAEAVSFGVMGAGYAAAGAATERVSRREFAKRMGLPKGPLPEQYRTAESRAKALQELSAQQQAVEAPQEAQKEPLSEVTEESAPLPIPTEIEAADTEKQGVADIPKEKKKTIDLAKKYDFEVDEEGTITAYHGTDRMIEGAFRIDATSGAFFSSDIEDARGYAEDAVKRQTEPYEKPDYSDIRIYRVKIKPSQLAEVEYDEEGLGFVDDEKYTEGYDAVITAQAAGDIEVVNEDIIDSVEMLEGKEAEKELPSEEKRGTIMVERRQDLELRSRVEALSPENRGGLVAEIANLPDDVRAERIDQLLHQVYESQMDVVTGLPTRIAWQALENEGGLKGQKAAMDVVGLGAVNDRLAYEGGDALLKGVAEVLKAEGLDVARWGGDELMAHEVSGKDFTEVLDRVNKDLKNMAFRFIDKSGELRTFQGAHLVYDTGATTGEAANKMEEAKRVATEQKIRPAKGELPGFLVDVDAERGDRLQGRDVRDKGQEREAPVEREGAGEEVAPLSAEQQSLVTANIGLVDKYAKRYGKKFGIKPDELTGPAFDGLQKAAEKYNPDKGPFERFANKWIKEHLKSVTSKQAAERKKQVPIAEAEQVEAPEVEGMEQDERDVMRQAVNALAEEDQPYVDVIMGDRTQVDLSKELGVSAETVRKQLDRIQEKLKRIFLEMATPAAKQAYSRMTRDQFRENVKDVFDYTDEETDANIAIADAVVERLVKDGHFESADDAYDSLIQEVKRGTKRGERAGIKFLENGKAVIRAGRAADASSFVHEFAHMMRRIASQYYPADMKAIEQWAGVKESKWTGKTEERFANAFEKYLREGVAPTKKLQAVFARFKEWLTDIYKKLTGLPINVRLNDDVRAFFDKMLGGTKAKAKPSPIGKVSYPITHYLEKIAGGLPGKNQAEAAGIDLQEIKESAPTLWRRLPQDGGGWDVIAQNLESSPEVDFTIGSKTDAQALYDALMDEHRIGSSGAKFALKGEITTAEADEMFAQWLNEMQEEDIDDLSQDELRSAGKRLGLRLTGLSKDAMIKKIKEAVEARRPGKAVTKEETAQFKGREKIDLTKTQLYKMLAIAKNKAWKAGKAEMQELKKQLFDYARENLPAGVREKAMAAIKNATTEQGFVKAIERIDVIAAQKEHSDAIAGVKKALDKAKKFSSGGDAFKKMFPHLRDEMTAFVEGIDFKKRAKGLKNVIEYLQTENKEMETPDELARYVEQGAELIGKRNIYDMSVEELQQVADTINYLIQAQKGLAENIHMERLGKRANVKDTIIERVGKPQEDPSGKRVVEKEGPIGKAWNRIGYNIEAFTVRFDKGDNGPVQQFFSDQINNARAKMSRVGKSFWAAYKKRVGDMKIPETWSHLLGGKTATEKFDFANDKNVNLTKGQKLYLYLLGQDAEGLNALLTSGGFVYNDYSARKGDQDIRSRALTEDDLAAIRKSMSDEEMKVANAIQDTMNGEIKNAINEATLERYGFEMARKENYMRIFRYSDEIKKSISDQLMVQQKIDPLENAGFLQERVGSRAKLIIPDVFQVFDNHINESAALSAYLSPMRNMYSILKDPEVRASIQSRFGNDAFRVFEGMMDRLRGSIKKNPDEGIFARLRGNYTISTLSLRPSTWVAQTLSYPSAATEVGEIYLLKALSGKELSSANRKIIDEIVGQSEILSDRWAEMKFDRDLGALSAARDLSPILTGKRALRNKLGYFISRFDQATVERIVLASHLSTEAKGGTLQNAVALAEKAVRRTQPTFDVETRTQLGGSKSELIRYLTMFRSYMDKALVNMNIQYHKKGTIASPEFARAAGYVLMMGALANTARLALYGLIRGKGDDKEPEDYLKDALMNLAGYLPLGGDMFKAVVSDYHDQDAMNAPVFDAVKDATDTFRLLGESIVALVNDEEYSKRTGKHKKGDSKAWAKFEQALNKSFKASRLTGIPIEGATQFLKDVRDVVRNAVGKERADYMMSSEEDRKYLYEKALENAKWNDGPLSYQDRLTPRQVKQYETAKQNHAGRKIKILTDEEPVLDREYRKEWGSKADEKFEERKEAWQKSREKAMEELKGYSKEDMVDAFQKYWTRSKEEGGAGYKRKDAYRSRLRRLRELVKQWPSQ